MKKIVAIVLVMVLASPLTAGVTYQGQVNQQVTFGGTAQPISAASLPLPAGASTSAKQPALGIAGTPSSDVITVQGATGMTAVKVDGSAVTQPVSVGGNVTVVQPTAANLKVDLSGTGANTTAIKVDGSAVTQPVSLSGSIPVNMQVLGTALDTGKGTTGNATLRVVVASDADTIKVMQQLSVAPAITKVIATTTSSQLLAANVNRKGIECATDCTDTSKIYINFGASAATTNSWPIEICSSWQPPQTMILTSALQVIAAIGDAAIVRCIEY